MFGLGPGPRIFTELIKIPIGLLRRLRIRLIVYIDDMLLMASSRTDIEEARDTTIHLLESLGYVINYEKSELNPCKKIQFLGVIVNSELMSLCIPQEKIQKLTELCIKTLKLHKISMRKLAKLLGKLKATAPAFSWAPLQTRHLQQLLITGLRKGLAYEDTVVLSEDSILEINWWKNNMRLLNGKPIQINPPDFTLSTDAAKGHRGGWGVECQGAQAGAHGQGRKRVSTSIFWNS